MNVDDTSEAGTPEAGTPEAGTTQGTSSASDDAIAVSSTPALTPTPSTSAGTRGFLFSDLRGYTAFVERAGDQAAAELLATYRSLVRGVIAAHDGAEIKTEGDSFYVVFGNASAAVEAGLEIVSAAGEQSTRERPVRVGVGIHAGETVATTEGLVGGAVNIAARVCAKAQVGEVLVTDTVRALTRTFLPYRYTSLGTQQLKGIAGGIPLFRVEAVPSSGRARLRRQLSARRGRVALVVGLAIVLLAVGAGVYAANRGPDCLTLPATTKDVVAKIDPARNCVVATYEVGARPGPIVAAGGQLWVGNVADRTVAIIDPGSGSVHFTGAGGTPDALTASPTAVWVLDGSLGVMSDISLTTRLPISRRLLPTPTFITEHPPPLSVSSPEGYAGLTFLGRSIWVTNRVSGQILPVNPDAAAVGRYRVPVPVGGGIQVGAPPSVVAGGPNSPPIPQYSGTGPISASGGTVWVASDLGPELWRIDPGSNKAQSVSAPNHGSTTTLVATPADVWATHPDGTVTRTSATSFATSEIKVGRGPSGIAVSDDAVWVANTTDGTISRIDPDTNTVVDTIQVGSKPAGVVVADDQVYVTLRGS